MGKDPPLGHEGLAPLPREAPSLELEEKAVSCDGQHAVTDRQSLLLMITEGSLDDDEILWL